MVALGCAASTPIGPPTFAATIDAPKAYTVDEEITPLVLPAATGGTGALTYSLTPEIPGLQFDAAARELTGTPTETGAYDMTYTARDEKDEAATLEFTITVAEFSLIATIVAAIKAGDTVGVPRFQDVPTPSGGPSVAVTGNHGYAAGGVVFLDIEAEPGAAVDKLLLSIGGESFGYYEIDLPDGASSYRLLGSVRFDLPPDIPRACLNVSAVDTGGAVGEPWCHVVVNLPVDFGDVQVTVSWDTDADLDLHVADPTGHEVYYGAEEVESGGVLDLDSGNCRRPDLRRNEHIAWSQGTPPPGRYEVRLSHFDSCDAEETSYVVRVYNHGTVSTFTGTFTGPGEDAARGTGRVITTFTVPGDAPPAPTKAISSTYRGNGDQVFVLNPGGELLDQTLYTLDLGSALGRGVPDLHHRQLPPGSPGRAARSAGSCGQGAADDGAGRAAAGTEAGARRAGVAADEVDHGVQQLQRRPARVGRDRSIRPGYGSCRRGRRSRRATSSAFSTRWTGSTCRPPPAGS